MVEKFSASRVSKDYPQDFKGFGTEYTVWFKGFPWHGKELVHPRYKGNV